MNFSFRIAAIALFTAALAAAQAGAQTMPPQPAAPAPPPPHAASNQFSANEVIDAGHRFFGGVSRGLAMVMEKAFSQWGEPNGYILGEEAGGAFVGGLRYGGARLTPKIPADLRCSG